MKWSGGEGAVGWGCDCGCACGCPAPASFEQGLKHVQCNVGTSPPAKPLLLPSPQNKMGESEKSQCVMHRGGTLSQACRDLRAKPQCSIHINVIFTLPLIFALVLTIPCRKNSVCRVNDKVSIEGDSPHVWGLQISVCNKKEAWTNTLKTSVERTLGPLTSCRPYPQALQTDFRSVSRWRPVCMRA